MYVKTTPHRSGLYKAEVYVDNSGVPFIAYSNSRSAATRKALGHIHKETKVVDILSNSY